MIEVEQEGSHNFYQIALAMLSIVGGLYTSVSYGAALFVSFITKPNVIAHLTQDLFLQYKNLEE